MNVREALIDLLIGGADVAASSTASITREGSWAAVLDLAARWTVIPNLRDRLTELRATLPEDQKKRLFQLFQQTFASSTLQARRGVSVCRKLEDLGIQVVVFKGLASIAHLYQGNPSHRAIKDVDILIREQDLEAALAVMEGMGLKPDHGGDLEQYGAFVKNSPGFAGNEALCVSVAGLGELDVHWSLGQKTAEEFRVEAIMQRAIAATLFDMPVHVISPCDGLLLSAHHALRENFAPDGMMRDVLDCVAWMKLLEQRGQLAACLDQARRCRIEDPVLALAEVAAARGAGVPSSGRKSSRGGALAQLFWHQAENGPLGKDFTYLADPHAAQQILRGTLAGGPGYAAYRKAFDVKLTGKPVPLLSRSVFLLQQMSRHGFRGWRMIRSLAKTKAAYQRGA